jgi:hypothetical protein
MKAPALGNESGWAVGCRNLLGKLCCSKRDLPGFVNS